MTSALSEMSHGLARIAYEAGLVILTHYAGATEVRTKPDFSPVTAADEEAERLIVQRLQVFAPGIAIIAEEAMAKGDRPRPGREFWLVDPLDGTKEFLRRNGEFTVNIALVRDGLAVAGVVHAPALGRMFVGSKEDGAHEIAIRGAGGFDPAGARPIQARRPPPEGLTAAISRTHGDSRTEEYLAAYDVAKLVSIGSSLKFCLIASGEADLYPRHGPTMEWDTAAGHAVLNAAGGSVTKLDSAPFLYGKVADGFLNPPFLARGLT